MLKSEIQETIESARGVELVKHAVEPTTGVSRNVAWKVSKSVRTRLMFWTWVPSLVPTAQVMPSSVWKMSSPVNGSLAVKLKRSIDSSRGEW